MGSTLCARYAEAADLSYSKVMAEMAVDRNCARAGAGSARRRRFDCVVDSLFATGCSFSRCEAGIGVACGFSTGAAIGSRGCCRRAEMRAARIALLLAAALSWCLPGLAQS